MHVLFSRYVFWYVGVPIALILLGGFGYYAYSNALDTPEQTATVARGTVTTLVTVSGKIEAKQVAKLAFPNVGTVQAVFKDDGDAVAAGEILASMTQGALVASYNTALQNLHYQESRRADLLDGPRSETRETSATNVAIAEENLVRTTNEHARIVENARQTLLSTDLEAIPVNKMIDDVPPIISGNYHCDSEGAYTISIFGSNSPTDYSYRLSGLETGTFTAFTDAAAPLGNCGLMIQFDADELYHTSDWTVSVPNTSGANYIANKNTYLLAVQQQQNVIESATQAVELARRTHFEKNAAPTPHELTQANALIEEARAQLAANEAKIADYVIKAPFAGIITDSNIKVGEVADTSRNMTLMTEGNYELTARIPEVDITKVHVNQVAEVLFDASPTEPISATITYISPTATDIDGVAYFEAHFTLSQNPTWLRTGLNADVNIVVEKKEQVLTIPKRFVLEEAGNTFVLTGSTKTPQRQLVQIGLIGNDGMLEVLNLPEGTPIIAP